MKKPTSKGSAASRAASDTQLTIDWEHASYSEEYVVAPFADTAQPFAASRHWGYRFLVVRAGADSCTGRLVELITRQPAAWAQAARWALAGTQPLLAGQAPGPVAGFTGALLVYSPGYTYRTGLAYETGVLQPLRLALPIGPVAPDTCYDLYLVGYDNTGTEVIHEYLGSAGACTGGIPGAGGGWGGSTYTGSGGGGGNSNTASVYVAIDGAKTDPKQELKCFTTTQGATLTIYVQQGKPGTSNLVGPNQVGHTFIGIQQNGITRYIGYYPVTGASSMQLMVGKSYMGEIRENSGHDYNISITTPINGNQLGTILNYASNFPTVYNLNNYNCADFGIAVGNLGGMNLPATTTSFGMFSGRSPGALGQDIRNMTPPVNGSINTNGGNAPTKQGSCP